MNKLEIETERTQGGRPKCSWVGCDEEAKMVRTVQAQGYPVCVKHYQGTRPTPPIVKGKEHRPANRNDACLCGSGKKAKHCHPTLTPALKMQEQARKRRNLTNKLLGS